MKNETILIKCRGTVGAATRVRETGPSVGQLSVESDEQKSFSLRVILGLSAIGVGETSSGNGESTPIPQIPYHVCAHILVESSPSYKATRYPAGGSVVLK